MRGTTSGFKPEYLDKLIEEATLDAYNEEEQLVGFSAVIEDNLAVPFQTQILGQDVSVTGAELTDDDNIVAVCARGDLTQRVPILDLPLPDPMPSGAEWIEAYRRWARG